MGARNFMELLATRQAEGYFVCVGLDTNFDQIPHCAWKDSVVSTYKHFNSAIIDATCDLVAAYKPNCAFYEAQGVEGETALMETISYIQLRAPGIPIVLDAKRGDIDNTNLGYITKTFDVYGADAITVHPYLGLEAMRPFLDRKEKGVIVLCRTSNKGAGELQDLALNLSEAQLIELLNGPARSLGSTDGWDSHMPLYQYVAHRVANHWNVNGNCAVVAGATYPAELAVIRRIEGDMQILLPGIGKQGADVEATVKAGQNSQGSGMIINSSRGIIFASAGKDFAEAARQATEALHQQITQYRTKPKGVKT